ncbi:MAG: aminotransferase class I/II-fold pyridoxal phosphate-dependent enzyme [Candidatus Dadabacteria bacterium]|nr:MAG: aminotransferase class I/II-fold pyridoxal phosphate-dependent enzyme [Candidatus Dadabacteria bacterium]
MEISSRAGQLSTYPIADLIARKNSLREQGVRIFDFGPGDPLDPLPDIIRQTVANLTVKHSNYPAAEGTFSLRKIISEYIYRRFSKTRINPETQIIVSSGSKEAIFNLPGLLIDSASKRRKVIGPIPGYPVYSKGTLMAGGEFYGIQLLKENHYLYSLADIPENILNQTAIAWLNYPHNPTGAGCSLEYLKEQYNLAQKYGILLCSDECYCDLYVDQKPHSLLEVSDQGVLAFHSLSKRSGMTGFRSGFVAGDKKLLAHYARYRNTTGTAPSEVVQTISETAWSDDNHVNERLKILTEKRAVLMDLFSDLKLDVYSSVNALYLWVNTPDGISALDYMEKLLPHGIVITPGAFFDAGYDDCFRVSLSPLLEDCRDAVDVWRKVHKNL